jgi:hypothetical protein
MRLCFPHTLSALRSATRTSIKHCESATDSTLKLATLSKEAPEYLRLTFNIVRAAFCIASQSSAVMSPIHLVYVPVESLSSEPQIGLMGPTPQREVIMRM